MDIVHFYVDNYPYNLIATETAPNIENASAP